MLLGNGTSGAPVVQPGRPSRSRADWEHDQRRATSAAVDLDRIDWERPLPDGASALSRDLLARWLASGDAGPVRPIVATSRAPGSRLNRAAPKLSGDLTASLEIGPDRDDRGRTVVAVRLSAGNRRARRALDEVGLDGGWVRRRGSATTTVHRTLTPDAERRVTALAVVDALAELLDRARWPLPTWLVTAVGGRAPIA